MKKYLSALLVLALCLSAAFAEGEEFAEEPQPTETPVVTEAPVEEEPPAPAEEPEPQPEIAAPEVKPEPVAEPAAEPEVIDDLMLPKDQQPLVAPVPELPKEYEGYIQDGGARTDGTLEELLSDAGKKTVYVSVKDPVRIEDFLLALLKDVTFLPDPEVFGDGYIVALTFDGEEIGPEVIEAAADEEGILVVSVVKEEKKPEPKPEVPEKVTLKVSARNFTDGAWQDEIPSFVLSGAPDKGYGYAAIIYDERIVPLSGDEFFGQEEGVSIVRFAILDALGDIADKSEKYVMMLDFTAPELMVEVSAERDYTMTLSAEDSLSGVAELSLDGGASWVPLKEGESIVHTEARKKSFAPGTIMVRDHAGNVGINIEEIVLSAIPRESGSAGGGYGGGGGGSGDGSSSASVPHASGDGDAAPYDAYELELPEGPVEVLTLGGEEIDLGLRIDDGEEPALFTASLTAWAVDNPEYVPQEDTLVVRAELDDVVGPYTCTWRINGAVLRKLYNTDISYLVLAAGNASLSLPTVGFTAGTRYAELKMEGVSTAEFEYEIVMRIDPDAEGPAPAEDGWNMMLGCEAEMHVEVGGERFDMIDRLSTPEMYFFDVYCGPSDLPAYPYGEYPRAETEVFQ